VVGLDRLTAKQGTVTEAQFKEPRPPPIPEGTDDDDWNDDDDEHEPDTLQVNTPLDMNIVQVQLLCRAASLLAAIFPKRRGPNHSSMGPACYSTSEHMPELWPNLPTVCQLACRISPIPGQFACQYGSHEVTGGTSRAMACCFTCDSTRHCMPMRCMHDDPPRPWHAVLHVVPRCSFLTHTSIILLPPRLEHPESGMQNVVLWHVDLRDCFSHTSPPLRPTAPPQRSSPRCRKPSSSARSASCGHASCSRPSDTRHRHAHLQHPSSLPDCSIQGLTCKK